jgi:hypothetical protein
MILVPMILVLMIHVRLIYVFRCGSKLSTFSFTLSTIHPPIASCGDEGGEGGGNGPSAKGDHAGSTIQGSLDILPQSFWRSHLMVCQLVAQLFYPFVLIHILCFLI